MSNAGLKLREPVIGDELDQLTYGRPNSAKPDGPRERRVSAAPRSRRTSQLEVHGPAPQAAADVYDSGRTRIDADGVRTVKIRGQATPARGRSKGGRSHGGRAQNLYERPIARYDQHPDRAAQWAMFLGVFMVVVAIVTGT